MSNYIGSTIVVIGNTNDVKSIASQLDAVDSANKIFKVGDYQYRLEKPYKINVVPENSQPSLQGKSYILFDVGGYAIFDCESFLQNVHYDQFCVYSEDECNMGMLTIWSNIPDKDIDQFYEESYDEAWGPKGFIRIGRTGEWHKPSATETLLLHPIATII